VNILLKHLRAFAPDVVYLNNLVGLGGLGLLGCLQHLAVPWVWQLGDAVPYHLCSLRCPEWPMQGDYYGEVLPHLAEAFNAYVQGTYVVCSSRLVGEIASRGLKLRDRVEILPYWFQSTRHAGRDELLENENLHIVSAGSLAPYKGTDLLIKAAEIVRDSGRTKFSLDLYGCVDSPCWQVLIDQANLRPQVTLHGPKTQAELSEVYRHSDVFAFPTWSREPFGVAPLEAAAQGCVPIMSECCGLAEWMLDGVDCLKAERSAEAFAGLFIEILDRKLDLTAISRRTAEAAWRYFHVGSVIPRVEHILQNAARACRLEAGRTEEAYRLAILAEKTAQVMLQESVSVHFASIPN
jgi:glycosyltransferase involved in cell wall biosynthesis